MGRGRRVVIGPRSLVNARALVHQDIEQVAQWNVQLHEDEGSAPLSVDAAAKRLRRWLEDRTFQGAIFLADGSEVGYVLYEHRPVHADQRAAESVYVRQFFISREARRQGNGTAAFKTFVREFIPRNANVVLDVKESNPSGQRFWESLSFKPMGVTYGLDRQDRT
jgi:ribosomal protein S18 acetylase RimI-like enzyme